MSVSECSDNLTLFHNASSYATPVHFNESTVLAFHCDFLVPYSLPITYVWYVNGRRIDETGDYMDYHFIDGHYTVTCQASYQIPRCQPCNKTKSLTVIIQGMRL